MSETKNMIKTTMIGGLIFLLPLVFVTAILAKAFKVMLVIAKPLDKLIPTEQIGGVALVNILAILLIVVACFVAGIAAKSYFGKRLFEWFDDKLMMFLPGYVFMRGITAEHSDELEKNPMTAVLAKLDDSTQLAFEVERTDDGVVTVYLPGAPNPWSGTIVLMDEARIEPLDQQVFETVQRIRRLGRGINIGDGAKAVYKMDSES